MINKIKKTIYSIENSKTPFIYFIMTFIFIVTLRNFLESFSSKNFSSLFQLEMIINYDSFYISLAFSLILLFYLFTKEKIIKIAKIILAGFTIVILPPILDLIISGGNGYLPTFLLPDIHNNIISRFFTFFGNMEFGDSSKKILCGVTPGIKIEIILMLILSFLYFKIKKINNLKNLFFTFLIYILIFTYFSTLIIIEKMGEIFNITYNKYSNEMITNFYFILIFLTSIALLYILNKKYLKIIVRDIRPFRLLHYELMFVLGIIIAKINDYNVSLNIETIFNFIIIIISVIFAWIYSVMTNNIEDYEIDKISNKERPLIKKQLDFKLYEKISWGILFIALFYASLAGFKSFFIILLFIGNYFIYSMPPLRLKRVPLFSKIFISLNSLILLILGFLTIQNNIKNLPTIIYFIFLIGFTAIINFIDIKDYEGDKKTGIKTLPVLLGLKKSKLLIGSFFLLGYLFIYTILPKTILSLIFILFGFLQFFLINKVNYKEKYIFITYLLALILFIFMC